MKLLGVVLVVVLGAVGGAAATAQETVIRSPWIGVAEKDFAENRGLGERLSGRPASRRQVAEARRLVGDGLMRARAVLAKYSDVPAAHHLVGSLLCLAYYPAPATRVRTNALTGSLDDQSVTVLLKGNPDPAPRQQGLAQLRQALDLSPPTASYRADYHLDYAEALLLGGQPQAAWDELAHPRAPRQGVSPEVAGILYTPLTPDQRLREARLYARTMRVLNRPANEATWWRNVLAMRPGDPEATAGLAATAAVTATASP